MITISKVLRQNNLRTNSYKKIGKTVLLNTNIGKIVAKPKNNSDIYEYLDSRSFNYYPKIVVDDTRYEFTEYIDEIEMPLDQKMSDMIKLVALLHSKTTYYEEASEDTYKKIYEDIINNIEYLNSYYNDLITIIESRVYMSPSEYLLARGISKVFGSLEFTRKEIDEWFNIVKDKKKVRYVVLHNNLRLDHFIHNKSSYLISWDKSKIDIPIFDLYKLYKREGIKYDFDSVLKEYEKNYPLLEEEKKLLFILISLPDKIELDKDEYSMCVNISEMLDSLYKAETIISPYYFKNTEQNPSN